MRKTPRLGLLVGLLLVGALLMAALPAPVMAVFHPMGCAGAVTLDGDPAPLLTTIDIYLGADDVPLATTTVTTVGQYATQIWEDSSRHGEDLIYRVNGFLATTDPLNPVFGWETQFVDLTAVSEEAPEVTTDPATSVHHNSATLNGYLDTLGEFTSVDVYFEYGTDTGYGDTTSPVTKSTTGSFSAPTSSTLDPDTEYHYRAVGGYDSKDAVGLDETFTTLAEPVWPHVESLGSGLNIISTPVWLDTAFDTVEDIIPTGIYTGGYRWTGTSFTSLSDYYVWKPLEAFYVYVNAGTTATFVPFDDIKAPNTRTLASNRWYLIGSSPFGGSGCQTMADVLVNLANNWSVVVKPTAANQDGASCTVNNPALNLCAYEGAFVYVGAGATRTIVGFCTMPVD